MDGAVVGIAEATPVSAVGEDLGEEGPHKWHRAEMWSLTGGPANAQDLPGSIGGGRKNGHGPALRRTRPNGTVALGRRGGNGPRSVSLFQFPFLFSFSSR
jgi:hypothetical protein